MRARDLAEPFPVVALDTDALEAARLLAAQRLPGLIVLRRGRPALHGPPRFAGPPVHHPRTTCRKTSPLARVYDEQASDELLRQADGAAPCATCSRARRTSTSCRSWTTTPPTIEVAAVMARMHSPVVAVVDGKAPPRRHHGEPPARPPASRRARRNHDRGSCRRGVRRRLRPHRHRAHPPGGRRPRWRGGDGAARGRRRRGRVLQRGDRRRLERHLPAARHDDHRQRSQADRRLRLPRDLGRQARSRASRSPSWCCWSSSRRSPRRCSTT